MTKSCTICGEIKNVKRFYELSRSKDGFKNQCKGCISLRDKEYSQRPEVKEKRRIYNNSPRGKEVKKLSIERHLIKLICNKCGKEFRGRKSQKYCSHKCSSDAISGKNSPNWKGGRIATRGYVRISTKGHPRATKQGYVYEHIIVMEKILGRLLKKHENVHHINGVKDDNRPENLELWTTSQPKGQRVEDKLKWAREIIKTYA